MPESAVSHVVEKLNERHEHVGHKRSRTEEVIEIIEAVVLALVAVATAWSGYQAARLDNRRERLYAESSKLRVSAEGLDALSGQQRLYDSMTLNQWIAARFAGQRDLMQFFERRFREEFHTAFAVWLTTDPFRNPHAPPGPAFMPEYHNATAEQADQLKGQAAVLMEEGTTAGETSDRYVRITVLLATVLLITAIGQRFRVTTVRTGLLITAFLLLCLPMWNLFNLWRAQQ
jgi:hypothetical protein